MTTHRRARSLLLVLASAMLFASGASAQQVISGLPSPRLYQVFPAGAKAGTTVEVVVSGRNLDEPKQLLFSNSGIKAEYVQPPKPEIDPKTKKPKPVMGALPADNYKFKITVPANTPIGHHDLRVVGKWGVSNPRTFVVGDLAEVNEKEPNNTDETAQRVELNTTINGTILNPTDVDYFVFKAKKGQRVVVSCLAGGIDSRMQPAIEIYDKDDKQLASNRNYNGSNAVTDFTAAEDGDYHVRLIQFTHTFRTGFTGGMPAGSSDNFYRLTISTTPWIDAIYPPVVEAGKTSTVTIYGRNLPGGKLDPTAKVDDSVLEKVEVKVTAPANGVGRLQFTGHLSPRAGFLDAFEYRTKNAAGSSNPFLINLGKAAVVTEQADNDTEATAQNVTLPCEIAGRIEKRRDRDWYSFSAKKGEIWNIEVFSHRLGAPTYMTFTLRTAGAKNDLYEVPFNESMTGYSRKFYSRSEDPRRYRFTVPADGKYVLLMSSRAGDSIYGPRHTYHVRITKNDPDFRLVTQSWASGTPDTPILYQGGQAAFSVLAQRLHGFTGDIELTAEGLPAGVTCTTQTISGSTTMTTLILSATAAAAEWSGPIRIKGTATINGKKVTYEARPGGVIWPGQQQAPTLSRVEHSLMLAVRGKAPYTLTPVIDKPTLTQGDKAVVTVKVDRLWPEVKNPMQVQVVLIQGQPNAMLPNNLRFNNNQIVNVAAAQKEGKFNVTVGPDVPPGVYNVVFRGQTNIPYNKDPMAKQKPNTIIVQPSAPLTVTILPKTLATLAISPTSANVKLGNSVNVNVRVTRRFNYNGEFKVSLVLPPNVKGVEAAEVTIPGDKNDVNLTIKVPADAMPGNRANLTVKAVALYNGKTAVTHEAKLNVNVTK